MDGIVSKLNVEKGERVLGTIQMAGTEIMRIANMSKIEVQVDVSESDIPRVSIGDAVDIDIDAYAGRKFKGTVSQIANTASGANSTAQTLTSDQVTNFIVKIRLDPASYSDLIGKTKKHPFRPGMSASVQIFTNTAEGVLSVPIMAVTTRDREKQEMKSDPEEDGIKRVEKAATLDPIKEVVFVTSADTVRMVEVKTAIQDDQYIQITAGLQEGEEIVIGPYEAVSRKLKQGAIITKEDPEKKRKEREKEKN